MGYFPFFVDIEGSHGLIVGGGKVAAHKISKLLPFKPRLRVVACEVGKGIRQLANSEENIEIITRKVEESDIDGMDFVIAASGDNNINAWISSLCNEHRIPINVVDDKDKCSFLFPSLIQKGKLTVGVSTSGTSPEIAAAVKNETAQFIPSNIEEILDYLSSIRTIAREHISDDRIRAKFLKDTAKECMDRNGIFTLEETLNRIDGYVDKGKNTAKGRVSLVGAGCAGYDLITLKGIQAVRNAQVLVYDDLIDARLVDFAIESCEKIYVGKRSGRHSMSQPDISNLLAQKAGEGKYVVRLKGGDPFVFGRASEEIEVLKAHGIEYEYIPGVTSPITAPGIAGIPVTCRNISRSFHVITGRTANTDDTLPEDMETIARLKGTLIFLMGLENIDKITKSLIENGKSPDRMAAVVHVRSDNTAQKVIATLSDIAEKVRQSDIKSPAVIVVGEVVDLCEKC